jgi:type VI protein secretion system component Hcp
MGSQENEKKPSSEPSDPEAKSSESELADEQLDGVSGGASATGGAGSGKVAVHDISITKLNDKSSP